MLWIWKLIPAPWRMGIGITGAVVVLGLLAGVYVHVEGTGYDRAKRAYEADIAATIAANRKLISGLNDDLADALSALATRNQELHHVLDDLDREADAAPDATDLGLHASSVRSLDAIR